jgi:putative hydrolase of the HAD superfamily
MQPFHDIKAIFFDAVGTLIHPDPPAAKVYAQVGRRHGSRLDLTTIRQRFADAFARQEELDLAGGLQTSEEGEYRRWRQIVAEVLDDVRDGAACFEELYRHFSLPGAWRCEEGVAEVADTLARRGLLLGIASNYDHRLRTVLAGLPQLRVFSHVVISSEVGWRKPARQFFDAACALLHLPARQVLFVGDDFINDYQGAEQAGSPALLFDPGSDERAAPRRIRRLAEVTGWIG